MTSAGKIGEGLIQLKHEVYHVFVEIAHILFEWPLSRHGDCLHGALGHGGVLGVGGRGLAGRHGVCPVRRF